MPSNPQILDSVRKTLSSERRIGPHAPRLAMDFDSGTLTLEGELPDIAAKKLALKHAAAVPEVAGIVDRLRVTPMQPMGDKEIGTRVRRAFEQEPAFVELALSEMVKGKEESVREPPVRRRGWIRLRVDEGVVTLEGEVPGHQFKRLAGVLAWWVPGSRDVVNGLEIVPDEADNDAEITDAVRAALEKDPFVDAGQIIVGTVDAVVTLAGLVPKDAEREMAEMDAWYVFGVERVNNRIEISSADTAGRR